MSQVSTADVTSSTKVLLRGGLETIRNAPLHAVSGGIHPLCPSPETLTLVKLRTHLQPVFPKIQPRSRAQNPRMLVCTACFPGLHLSLASEASLPEECPSRCPMKENSGRNNIKYLPLAKFSALGMGDVIHSSAL